MSHDQPHSAAQLPVPSPADDRVSDTLAALRREYAASLPARLQDIGDLRAALGPDVWRTATVEMLIHRCHELAGSAASLGFNQVGDSARSIEAALRTYVAGPQPDSLLREAILNQLQHLTTLPIPDPDTLAPLPNPLASSVLRPINGPAPVNLERRIVYIVDDNLLVAEQLSMQLQYFGYEVTMFGRLSEFAEAYRTAPPDMVVLDIDFPEEKDTGPALYSRLMAESGIRAPVVFISNRDDIQSRLAAVRAGGGRYLAKPVGIGDLIDAIDLLTGSDPSDSARVLIVDDSPSLCKLHAAILEAAGLRTMTLTNPLGVLDALSEFQPDLMLIDLYMPECSGTELASVIRQLGSHVGLPIVFLSSEADRGKQLSAMQLGADDFLTKPVEPDHLVAAVRNRVARSSEMRALMKNDSLTGLLNHISFLDAAAIELSRARRANVPCTFAMIDLDHFKSINDTHGHPVGDRVLKSIARQLKQRLRNVDIVGRYGGEEFAVLFSNADGRTALRIINGIRDDFACITHSSAHGPFSATFSCGLAGFPEFQEIDRMIEAADKGLYEAKRRGRNCAVYVTPPQRGK